MSEDAEIELAIQRLEELFPYSEDDTSERSLWLTLVPREVKILMRSWKGDRAKSKLTPLNDLPNAFRIISSYLRLNLFQDEHFRQDVITAVFQKEGIKEVRKRARELEILGEYEDWEVNEDNIAEIINPGQFRKSRKMRAFLQICGFPECFEPRESLRQGILLRARMDFFLPNGGLPTGSLRISRGGPSSRQTIAGKQYQQGTSDPPDRIRED